MSDLPALTGRQLIALLKKGRVDRLRALGETLHRIISVKQSGIGRKGLLDMIERHGI